MGTQDSRATAGKLAPLDVPRLDSQHDGHSMSALEIRAAVAAIAPCCTFAIAAEVAKTSAMPCSRLRVR